jgi:predicted O-methyltransferase YrrM
VRDHEGRYGDRVLGDKVGDAPDFEIEGVRFSSGFIEGGEADAFTMVKSADLVTHYENLLDTNRPARIVELGIAYGGSTAFLALRARPRKLVAIEYNSARLANLDRFMKERGLGEVVRPYFGVDQGDRGRVGAILAEEFGDESIDLVFDDASHRYGPTLASFETIFPRLRAGGMYIIEDWRGLHEFAAALERRLATGEPDKSRAVAANITDQLERRGGPETPLSQLVVEFTLVEAAGGAVIDEVCVNPHWIAVRRGAAALPEGFRLTDYYADPFGMVRPRRLGSHGS